MPSSPHRVAEIHIATEPITIDFPDFVIAELPKSWFVAQNYEISRIILLKSKAAIQESVIRMLNQSPYFDIQKLQPPFYEQTSRPKTPPALQEEADR